MKFKFLRNSKMVHLIHVSVSKMCFRFVPQNPVGEKCVVVITILFLLQYLGKQDI